jgi:hypothetical protein
MLLEEPDYLDARPPDTAVLITTAAAIAGTPMSKLRRTAMINPLPSSSTKCSETTELSWPWVVSDASWMVKKSDEMSVSEDEWNVVQYREECVNFPDPEYDA